MSEPAASTPPHPSTVTGPARGRAARAAQARARERSLLAMAWYEIVRLATVLYGALRGGLRVTGRRNLPRSGGALIVSNHLSYLDVFVLGVGSPRPLNYVARSSLFKPILGPLIHSVGGFPIEREGRGVAGVKETLKRLRAGGLVLIFPEGTRSRDGEIGPLKPGIAALARAGVPFIPTAVAGTFEALPPGRWVPRSHPLHIHYGRPIPPEEVAVLSPEALMARIREGMLEAQGIARRRMARALGVAGGLPGNVPARRRKR